MAGDVDSHTVRALLCAGEMGLVKDAVSQHLECYSGLMAPI